MHRDPIRPYEQDLTAGLPRAADASLDPFARYPGWTTERNDDFEDIVRLASLVCRAPIATIVVLGANKLWHQAVFGAVGAQALDLHVAFSRLVLGEAGLVVIGDARVDPRFRDDVRDLDNQLPRFCAGVPLKSVDGHAIGTLAVFDHVERDLSDETALALAALARQCVRQLELRRGLEVEREAEERLGLIFDSATDYAIMALDLEGRINRWNAGARHIFGWTEKEAIGRHVAMLFIPLDRDKGMPDADLRKAVEHGRDIHERYYQRKDRSQFWGTGETMPLIAPGGHARGYLKILRDRTAQKRIKEALEYQTGVLQAITDHLAEALFQVDVDHRVTFLNPAAEEMFGWSRDELLGVNLHDRLHHRCADGTLHREDCPYVVAMTTRASLAHRPDVFVRRDGRLIDVVVSLTPIIADGLITGAVMTVTDVTETRKVEEDLRRTQERYRLAVMASDIVGSWDWDLRARTVVADANFAEQCGVDPKAAELGAPLEDFQRAIHPEDRQLVFAAIDACIASRSQYVGEYRILRPDGSIRWVSAHARCHYDASGRPTRLPGLSVDITERKRNEERRAALLELEDRLRNEETTADISGRAAEIVCRLLAVNRAGYGVFDTTGEYMTIERDHAEDGSPSLASTYKFDDYGAYGAAIKNGALMTIDDVASDPRTADNFRRWRATNVGALVNVPLIAEGRLAALFFVHSTTPRNWTSEDVALIANVADRTWAAISRTQSAARQKLLTGELHHRIKNTMAMVLAIANQTMRHATTKEAGFAAFQERMLALSEAQNILMRTSWLTAPIEQIVASALAPHRPCVGDRIRVDGPGINLSAQVAVSFALALHELATNATKYGALSNDTGVVSIVWSTSGSDDETAFRFTWREQGGPPVAPPTRRGFGSRLIEGSFPRAIKISIDYAVDGLSCTFEAPIRAL